MDQNSPLYRPREAPKSVEEIVQERMQRQALARLKRDPPPRPGAAAAGGVVAAGQAKQGAGGATPQAGRIDDADLVASMAKRLSLLEKELKSKAREVEKLHSENDSLKSKLHAAEEEATKRGAAAPADAHADHAGGGPQQAAAALLKSENSRLKRELQQALRQIADMSSFLNDYGMTWVGDHAVASHDGSAGAPDVLQHRRRSSANGAGAADAAAAAAAAGHPAHPPGLSPRPPSGSGPSGGGQLPPRPPQAGVPDAQAADAGGGAGNIRRRSYTGASSSSSSAAAAAPGGPGKGGAGAPAPRAGGSGWSSGSGAPGGDGSGSPVGGPPFRMADLLARVEELNQLAGDGCGQLVPAGGAGGGHVLHTPEPVRLTIFRDGIQLHRSAPQPFHEPGVQAVLADVLDGYFPQPLKHDFPDGVPIKVVDRTRESYKDALSPVNHPALRGGAGGGGGGGGGGGNVRTFHDLEAGEGAPMGRDAFLARLPQAVIRNGKVIDVRNAVGKAMGGPDASSASSGAAASNPSVILVATPADALLTTSQRNHKGPVLPPPSRESSRPVPAPAPAASSGAAGSSQQQPPPQQQQGAGASVGSAQQGGPEACIATLQIKSEDGQHTFIVKMHYDDTIGALRKYINAHRASSGAAAGSNSKGNSSSAGGGGDYEIRTAFPPRKYDNLAETLREAGLVPNATLFLRAAAAHA